MRSSEDGEGWIIEGASQLDLVRAVLKGGGLGGFWWKDEGSLKVATEWWRRVDRDSVAFRKVWGR